jgi:hypothetical protein
MLALETAPEVAVFTVEASPHSLRVSWKDRDGSRENMETTMVPTKRQPCPKGCGKRVAPTGRGSHYRVCPNA